jgi:hypothetical protein
MRQTFAQNAGLPTLFADVRALSMSGYDDGIHCFGRFVQVEDQRTVFLPDS